MTRRVFRVLLEEVVNQNRNVFSTFAQRRHVDREHVDAVIKVVAETTVSHHRAQVTIGRGYHTHVDAKLVRTTDATNLSFLQRAQKFGLNTDVQFRDLVEKQRAAIGDLKEALLLCVSAGERTLFMSEQLRLEQEKGTFTGAHAE